jgi:hypothetical protein
MRKIDLSKPIDIETLKHVVVNARSALSERELNLGLNQARDLVANIFGAKSFQSLQSAACSEKVLNDESLALCLAECFHNEATRYWMSSFDGDLTFTFSSDDLLAFHSDVGSHERFDPDHDTHIRRKFEACICLNVENEEDVSVDEIFNIAKTMLSEMKSRNIGYAYSYLLENLDAISGQYKIYC